MKNPSFKERELKLENNTLEMITEIIDSVKFKNKLAQNIYLDFKDNHIAANKRHTQGIENISCFNQTSFHNVKRHFKYTNDACTNRDLCMNLVYKVISNE